MTTVCAWCVAEGLAENPPGKVSHAICSTHTLRLTGALRAAVAKETAEQEFSARLDARVKAMLQEAGR
jgi:hypothetical protein